MKKEFIFLFSIFNSMCYAIQDAEYKKPVQALLNQHPLCISALDWPISLNTREDIWAHAQMNALSDAGLAVSKTSSGKQIWELSKMGRNYFTAGQGFCYGIVTVQTIVQTYHQDKFIVVEFKYTLSNAPLWANHKSIRTSNTDLDNILEGINKTVLKVKLLKSNNGNLVLMSGIEPTEIDY